MNSEIHHTSIFQKATTLDENGVDDVHARQTFWEKYVHETRTYDDELIKGWSGDLDVILVFSGLFSAVNTAFITVSYQLLQPSPMNGTNVLLAQILQQLNSSFTAILNPATSFSPPPSSVSINALFFASLCCSLFTAFGAVIGKQWLYEYTRLGPASSYEDRGRKRQQKYDGIKQWHLRPAVEFLPTLLQISLISFQIGLIQFLWQINNVIAVVVLVFTLIPLTAYFAITLLSAIRSESPYQSPITELLRRAFSKFLDRNNSNTRDQPQTRAKVDSALHIHEHLDWDTAKWLLANSDDVESIILAARFIPTCRPKDISGFNRLCHLYDRFQADEKAQYAIGRAMVHIVSSLDNIEPKMMRKLTERFPRVASEAGSEIDLIRASIHFLSKKDFSPLIYCATRRLATQPPLPLPLWFVDIMKRALPDILRSIRSKERSMLLDVGELLVKAYSLDPLPPLDHINDFYTPLVFGLLDPNTGSNAIPLPETWTEGILKYNTWNTDPSRFSQESNSWGTQSPSLFELIKQNTGSTPTSKVAESMLGALVRCCRIDNSFPKTELAYFLGFLFFSCQDPSFRPIASRILYRLAVQNPWEYWNTFTFLDSPATHYGVSGDAAFDMASLSEIMHLCEKAGEESLMGALLILVPVFRELREGADFSRIQAILSGHLSRVDVNQIPRRDLALGLIASMGYILFSRDDNPELHKKIQSYKIYLSLQDTLFEINKTVSRILASTTMTPDTLVSPHSRKFVWYHMVIIDACHTLHHIDLIEKHLYTLVRLQSYAADSSPWDPRTLDALLCLWNRVSRRKPGSRSHNTSWARAFVTPDCLTAFNKALLKLCPRKVGDIFQRALHAYVDMYRNAPNKSTSMRDAYKALLQKASSEGYTTVFDNIEWGHVCINRKLVEGSPRHQSDAKLDLQVVQITSSMDSGNRSASTSGSMGL